MQPFIPPPRNLYKESKVFKCMLFWTILLLLATTTLGIIAPSTDCYSYHSCSYYFYNKYNHCYDRYGIDFCCTSSYTTCG